MVSESPQISAARTIGAELEARRWDGGIRIVLQGAMRAPVRDGEVTLEASWRADVFVPPGRRAAFTMVAETPAQALRDVAALLDGELDLEAKQREQQ